MQVSRKLIVLGCFFVLICSVSAQEASPEEKAMMEAYMKSATPGEPHHEMTKMEGKWNADMTLWMKPGAPPERQTGTAVMKMILGGRYLQQEFQGEFMGQPFHGIGYTGYNNATGKVESTWMDSAGTSILYMEGTDDEAGVITTYGQYVDPVSKKTIKVKGVTKVVDDNKHVFEMYNVNPDGSDHKSFEIVYTRQQTS